MLHERVKSELLRNEELKTGSQVHYRILDEFVRKVAATDFVTFTIASHSRTHTTRTHDVRH